jgi:hypothetical protein
MTPPPSDRARAPQNISQEQAEAVCTGTLSRNTAHWNLNLNLNAIGGDRASATVASLRSRVQADRREDVCQFQVKQRPSSSA